MTTTKATDEDFIGLKLFVCLLIVVAGPLIWGIVFKTLWNWIATQPPFGMPELNLLSAVGIGAIVAMFAKIPDRKSQSLGEVISGAFTRWFLYLLLLGIFALYRAIL